MHSPSRGWGSTSFPGRRAASWRMTPPSTISSRSSCRITDGIQSPWIQSLGRAVLEEDPPRADFFPFPCTAAFFARSRADVLSFTIIAGKARTDLLHGGESGGGG